jgi:peptidoglycan hydrolase-like protein with peptidoglycan-binding domain
VYGVLARSYNHLSNKSTYQPDSVIKYCDLAMNSNEDNAVYRVANLSTSGTKNYFGPFRSNIGALIQGQFIADLLSGKNDVFPLEDPRIYYLLRENNNGTFKGIRPGYGATGTTGLSTADLPKNFWGGDYASSKSVNPRYLYADDSPWPVMTATEMQFMKAEAAYRKGDKTTALEAYKNGISLSMDMMNDYPANIPAGKEMTPTAKAAYMTTVPAVNDLTLTHIMLQKYIALYCFGVSEVWVDMRRFHYIDPDAVTGRQVYANWTPLTASELFINNNQQLVYRCRPRYNSEYLYNIPALTMIGATELSYHTKECWFSQQ